MCGLILDDTLLPDTWFSERQVFAEGEFAERDIPSVDFDMLDRHCAPGSSLGPVLKQMDVDMEELCSAFETVDVDFSMELDT